MKRVAVKARIRKLEEMEAERKGKEEHDRAERAKKRALEIQKIAKEDQANVLTKPIQLFVKIYGRETRTIVLGVEPSDTFKTLKDMIQEKEGIPPNQQSLNYYGRRLRDELTLSDYSIINERQFNTIELVRRSSINSHFLRSKDPLVESIFFLAVKTKRMTNYGQVQQPEEKSAK